jgi:hypothetical protein
MRRDHRGLPDAHPGRVSLIVDRRRLARIRRGAPKVCVRLLRRVSRFHRWGSTDIRAGRASREGSSAQTSVKLTCRVVSGGRWAPSSSPGPDVTRRRTKGWCGASAPSGRHPVFRRGPASRRRLLERRPAAVVFETPGRAWHVSSSSRCAQSFQTARGPNSRTVACDLGKPLRPDGRAGRSGVGARVPEDGAPVFDRKRVGRTYPQRRGRVSADGSRHPLHLFSRQHTPTCGSVAHGYIRT